MSYKILTALGIGMLTSCYGMPVTSNYSCVYGKVTGTNEQPVKGIKVSLKYNGMIQDALTSEAGDYYFEIEFGAASDINAVLTFEDIDAEINGSYKTKTEEITLSEYGDCEKDVTLEEMEA